MNLTPLGMLDSAAVAVPAVSPETIDDAGAAAAATESSGAAPVSSSRETSGAAKEEGGGKEGRRRRRPKRSKSIRRFLGRTSSNVLSYLTIMTTWVLFRFLLKGLNKV